MTERKGPKRGPGGRFLKSDAQRDEIESRSVGKVTPMIELNGPAGKTIIGLPMCTMRKKCEECGTTMEETRVRIRRHVMYISHCPRCTVDPLQVLRE